MQTHPQRMNGVVRSAYIAPQVIVRRKPLVLSVACGAHAQAWKPQKPVEVVVPTAAGGANDNMALGAIKAIYEAGKKGKLSVAGFDNIPDVQPYLKSGELYATIEQHPDLMGKYGARMAVGVLNGGTEKGREFLVPLEVIKGSAAK